MVCDPLGPFNAGIKVYNFNDHKHPLARRNEEPILNEFVNQRLTDLCNLIQSFAFRYHE